PAWAAVARRASATGTPSAFAAARARPAAARRPASAPSRFTGTGDPLTGSIALFAFGEREELATRQPDLAVALDADDLDLDLLALGEDVRRGLGPLVRHLRDMEERLGVRQDLDERAEVGEPPHRAAIHAPDLGLRHEA